MSCFIRIVENEFKVIGYIFLKNWSDVNGANEEIGGSGAEEMKNIFS